jgi:undecaprenyl-diphosphatase
VIGTIVPGSTIVFAAGVLAGLHALNPWYVGIIAIAGALLGDWTSYVLGRRYRRAIPLMWPLRTHPALLARGEAYFAKSSGKAVFLGRFLGPIRAFVPLIAGMSRMPAPRFFPINALAVVGWAAAHLVPGVLFGASLQLAGAVSSRLVALVAILFAGAWVIAKLARLATRHLWPYVEHLRDRLYARIAMQSTPLARFALPLFDPTRHEPMALLVSATLLVAGAWLFLGVVEDVVTRDTLVDVDQALYASLRGLRTKWSDDLMVTITELASAPVMIALIASMALWFAIRRRFRTLGYWIAAVAFANVMVVALKYALGRARPETAHGLDEYSFPSGHAAMSMVVYGFLAFLLGQRKSAAHQTAFALGAFGIAALVGFSRLYLGVHWLSDVIASFGLGIAWMALLAIAYIQHVREPPLRAGPVLGIVLAVLVFVGGTYTARHHTRDVERYAKPAETPTMSLDTWRNGGWATLPAFRGERASEREERLSLQWVATRGSIVDALGGADWVLPARWKSPAALLWLLPSTPIAELPVLPKFQRGQPPALTLIRPLDARERMVIRLWNVADAEERDLGQRIPIFVGTITAERTHSQWGLLTIATTEARAPDPTEALGAVLRERPTRDVMRSGGERVLLIW